MQAFRLHAAARAALAPGGPVLKAKSRGEALRDYVVRRCLLMIPTFIGVTFATFLLCQFVPGG